MDDVELTIQLECLFCDSALYVDDKEKGLQSGDMIECANCHELNDFDALMGIAYEKAEKMLADYADKEVSRMLGKLDI